MTGLLALHTATDLCEVAFGTDDGVLTLRADGPRSHSERLVPLILEITKENVGAIRRVAVAAGPGSFTGLRIGLSTAKGIAYGRDLPVLAVSTLAALAFDAGCGHGHGDVAAVMRARRDELYAGLYQTTEAGVTAVTPDTVVTDDGLQDWIARHTGNLTDALVAGPNAVHIAGDAGIRVRAVDVKADAVSVLRLSALQPDEYIVHDIASFEPYYCKEFVAKKPRQSIFDRIPF